jgi:hypothetical protein
MMAYFGTTHTAEKFLCRIGASAVERVSLLVIDPLHREAEIECIP